MLWLLAAVALLIGGLVLTSDRSVRGLAWACVAIGGGILAWMLIGLASALIGRPDSPDFWDRFSFWAMVGTAVAFFGTIAVFAVLGRLAEKQSRVSEGPDEAVRSEASCAHESPQDDRVGIRQPRRGTRQRRSRF